MSHVGFLFFCLKLSYRIFIEALYGVLFKNDKEAAFSNYRLW